jgi:hypothetical protein
MPANRQEALDAIARIAARMQAAPQRKELDKMSQELRLAWAVLRAL